MTVEALRRDEQERQMRELLPKLDMEQITIMTLLAMAMLREDETLVQQLKQYGHRPRVETAEDLPKMDMSILEQVKDKCDRAEAESWGRLLVCNVLRGDLEGRAMVLDMVRHRVAS